MKRKRDDQPRLPIDLPERTGKRRRPKPRRTYADGPQRELIGKPLVHTCGFCGHRQTVFEDVGVCDRCGGVIIKGDPDEEEWTD